MKYKKQIVIICLFTFLMLPFQKYEEPKAEILTLTAGTIIACAALATAAGVIITNPDMLEDVGTIVYDGIKNIPNVIENVGDNIKINVTKDLLNTVVTVCNTIPKVNTIKEKFYDYVLDEQVYSGDIVSLGPSKSKGIVYFTARSSTLSSVSVTFGVYPLTKFSESFTVDESSFLEWDFTGDVAKFRYSSCYPEWVKYSFSNALNYDPVIGVKSNVSGYISIVNSSVCADVNIPYTEENTENVSADKPLAYFPTGSGSISVPIDTPLSNYNPSVDNPISLPTDLVGDGISVDVDTSTDTGAIDKPNTDVGEVPTTGEGLWDSLFGWLGTLFAPLTALLEWIGEMVNSILDTLKNLIMPKEMDKINFSPLYFSFADKFPFCIPFDLIRMVKEFQTEEEKPIFKVDMSGFSSGKMTKGEVGFTIDLTKFDDLILIVKTLTLVSFIFGIAFKTRDIIKG